MARLCQRRRHDRTPRRRLDRSRSASALGKHSRGSFWRKRGSICRSIPDHEPRLRSQRPLAVLPNDFRPGSRAAWRRCRELARPRRDDDRQCHRCVAGLALAGALRAEGGDVVGGGALATPYAFGYDMAAIAIPVAFLARDQIRCGLLRGEQTLAASAVRREPVVQLRTRAARTARGDRAVGGDSAPRSRPPMGSRRLCVRERQPIQVRSPIR